MNKKNQIIILISLTLFFLILATDSNLPSSDDYKSNENLETNSNGSINILTPENKTYQDSMAGYYLGTFSFESDDVDLPPSSADWEDGSTGTSSIRIIDELGGHKNVLHLSDANEAGTIASAEHIFTDTGPVSSGTVELWFRTTDVVKLNQIILRYGLTNRVRMSVEDFKWHYSITSNTYEIPGLSSLNVVPNTWYHIRLDFEASSGGYQGLGQYKWKVTINGIDESSQMSFASNGQVSRLRLVTAGGDQNWNMYVDAVGLSLDTNYNIGDNIEEGLLLSYETSIPLNSLSYSLDEQSNKTILGNTTIPMPKRGAHTIQVYGVDSEGGTHHSDLRYFSVGIPSIYVDDSDPNNNWEQLSSKYSWCTGSGTKEDPYILENITINSQDQGTCIEIKHSSAFFIIRNCTLTNTLNVSSIGIGIIGCHNAIIVNNSIFNQRMGLYVAGCTNVSITHNIIANCSWEGGIYFGGTFNSIIQNNHLIECGFKIGNFGKFVLFSNVIDSSNTVNGKPFYLYVQKSLLNSLNFSKAGQIILIYCNFSIIQNLDDIYAISLQYCYNTSVLNNIIKNNNEMAFRIWYSHSTYVYNNSIFNDYEEELGGIGLSDSLNTTLIANKMYDCGVVMEGNRESFLTTRIEVSNTVNNKPLYFYLFEKNLNSNNFTNAGQIILINCSFCQISNLNISDTSVGLTLYYSYYNNISRLNLIDNFFGLRLFDSHFNTFSDSNVSDCKIGISQKFGCSYNEISNCYISNSFFGIQSSNSLRSSYFENIIFNNIYGFTALYNEEMVVVGNNFTNNKEFGLRVIGVVNSIFYLNYFNNPEGINAQDNGNHNSWDNGSIGNYWHDYQYFDFNDNGIGDLPYEVSGDALSVDNYPIWDDGYNSIFIDNSDPAFSWSKTAEDNWSCTGSGTLEDPYVIENVTLIGPGYTNHSSLYYCITIINSNVPFIIRNCIINGSYWGDAYGIILENVINGTIINNSITSIDTHAHGAGIYVSYCSSIKIADNTFTNCLNAFDISSCTNFIIINNSIFNLPYGDTNGIIVRDSYHGQIIENYINGNFNDIFLQNSQSINISGNRISGNAHGIRLEDSDNNLITNNYIDNCHDAIKIDNGAINLIRENWLINNRQAGISVSGFQNIILGNILEGCGILTAETTHSIDNTNLVNGKPVYFYLNRTSLNPDDFINAGQIILANCHDVIISNVEIVDATRCINLIDCSNVRITNCVFSSNFLQAILLVHSVGNEIADNTFHSNGDGGILLTRDSTNNFITKNKFIDGGIWSYTSCDNNIITDNYFERDGIDFRSCDNNSIYNNEFVYTGYALRLSSGTNNAFYGNIIRDCNNPYSAPTILLRDTSYDNLLYSNTFINNNLNAYDDGVNNKWDNGTLGNLWGDYNGTDIIPTDGIGDQYYHIPGSAESVDRFPIFPSELCLKITPLFTDAFVGESLAFSIDLTNIGGREIPLEMSVMEQYGYWDSHDVNNTFLNNFIVNSGTVFHNETGLPSSSPILVDGNPFYSLLENLSFPENSLIVVPEIMQYDPITKNSRQKIEIIIKLDLNSFMTKFNIHSIEDISYLNTKFFGSSFLEAEFVEKIEKLYGKVEIYNIFTDEFRTLDDRIINEALRFGIPNGNLSPDMLEQFSYNFTAEELYKYINIDNTISFRLTSYFEGVLNNAENSYLSAFQPNSVLGNLLNFVNFDIVWWKEEPTKVIDTRKYTDIDTNITYVYQPTAPGTYTISFNVESRPWYPNPPSANITFEIWRKPVDIYLQLGLDYNMTQTYSTQGIGILVKTHDLEGHIASNARVNVYSFYNGSEILLGSDITDGFGKTTITVDSLYPGNHIIYAVVQENHGRYSIPFKDEPFENDFWAESRSYNRSLLVYQSQSNLEIISLAPEGFNVIAMQQFYIYPKLVDLNTGDELYNEEITLFLNLVEYAIMSSRNPFIMNFSSPGLHTLEAVYSGTLLLNASMDSEEFSVNRLQIAIEEISPSDEIFYPNQEVNITVYAHDKTFNLPASNVHVILFSNLTHFPILDGYTNGDGRITFTFDIPMSWASNHTLFYAQNSEEPGVYLQHQTEFVEKYIRPYETSILYNIDSEELHLFEDYTFTFNLMNLDLNEVVLNQIFDINLLEGENLIAIYPSIDELSIKFNSTGLYTILVQYSEDGLYLGSIINFSFEILKRPTHIKIDITDMELVVGNEFSVTVYLMDSLSNTSLLNEALYVYENIYDNGSLVESKERFRIVTGWTNTFYWKPLKAANFEFIINFSLSHINYSNSDYSIIYQVSKREVQINAGINKFYFKVEDEVLVNSQFFDLNSTNLLPIYNLTVHFLIQEGNNTIFSQNYQTDEDGIIEFVWQIPSNLINSNFTLLIITASTNYYHWNYVEIQFETAPLDTFFEITTNPNPRTYINNDILIEIDLFSIQDDVILPNISIEIINEENQYYLKRWLNLTQSNQFIINFANPGIYEFRFFYNGTEIYATTEISLLYHIWLYPCVLEPTDSPQSVLSAQESFDINYYLFDGITGEPIEGVLVVLYYIDYDTSAKVDLNLAEFTDVNGSVLFNIMLPDIYPYESITIFAEVNATITHQETTSSLEILISPTPTFISLNTSSESFQFYLDQNLTITLELFDAYGTLIIGEMLKLDIETPLQTITLDITVNYTFSLNFSELGIYRVMVSYLGNQNYLSSSIQTFFACSPVPTSIDFIEDIPESVYFDESIMLIAQLSNNLTKEGLQGEVIKFIAVNDSDHFLLFEGITNQEGILFFVWEDIEPFSGHNITIYAVYDYTMYYENSSTIPKSVMILKYDTEIKPLQIPDKLTPLTEELYLFELLKTPSGGAAENGHINVLLFYPNGTELLIFEGYTDINGIFSFHWMPSNNIFKLNEIQLKLHLLEDQFYNEEIEIFIFAIDKIETFISIVSDATVVQPDETVQIQFDLYNIFNHTLVGEELFIEIKSTTYYSNFTIIIGQNSTYDFLVPNYGIFEIIGLYNGSARHYGTTESGLLYSEKFNVNINLSILESFTKNKTDNGCGEFWNFHVYPYLEILTLIANVTIEGTDIPLQGIEVNFYYFRKGYDPIFLGLNLTNNQGIASLKWNRTSYCILCKSALFASIEETSYHFTSVSEPIYLVARRIRTDIILDYLTKRWQIGTQYQINISLFDEFGFELMGKELIVKIFNPRRKLQETFFLTTNYSTHIEFTPSTYGFYRIDVIFEGVDRFRKSKENKVFVCSRRARTRLSISSPRNVEIGKFYNLKILLTDEFKELLNGELIKLEIIYRTKGGLTEIRNLEVVMGINNTFSWAFPDYDEFLIIAKYEGSVWNFESIKTTELLKSEIPQLSFLEILLLLSFPLCLIFYYSTEQSRKKKWSKNKKIFIASMLMLVTFGSNYANIALICSKIETKGIISHFDVNSGFYPQDPSIAKGLSVLNDALDYGSDKINNIQIDDDWIPNLENNSSPYDVIIQNSTIIPPEADKRAPYIRFVDITDNETINNKFIVKTYAVDEETAIQEVIFSLLYMGQIVEQELFSFNATEDLYSYVIDSTKFEDGEYEIYAQARDLNNNTKSIKVNAHIKNDFRIEYDPSEFDYTVTELTDDLNVTIKSTLDGLYNVRIKNDQQKVVYMTSDTIVANKLINSQISINPLYFTPGNYRLIISVTVLNELGFYKTQSEELDLIILRESVKLELGIDEGENLYSDHYITLRARLIENDYIVSEQGDFSETPPVPISGQVLTFEIADTDNSFLLGTRVTDENGYATFSYNLSLSKGMHVFNVTFNGNNIYKSLENMKMFENQGGFTFINLVDVKSPVPYKELTTIKAQLFGDNFLITNQTLYFNITNNLENIYVGASVTDGNGEATIYYPCDLDPGSYNIIVSFDGNSQFSNNVTTFENRLIITPQNTDLTILSGRGSTIYCPFNFDSELLAKLLIRNADIGIKDIPMQFVIRNGLIAFILGTTFTDQNGLSSILFTPSQYEGLTPGNYELNVYINESKYYHSNFALGNIVISKDIPLISIQGTETLFGTEFNITAKITDSLLNPIRGETLFFTIFNDTQDFNLGQALTNEAGIANINIGKREFLLLGTYGINVSNNPFSTHYSYAYAILFDGLKILPQETKLVIQGSEKGTAIEPYNITLFLTDIHGSPLEYQKIQLECYRENGTINLLPSTVLETDSNGTISYSFTLGILGTFILKAYYQPSSDNIGWNDGFLPSYGELTFILERAKADLSITQINHPSIKRGETLIFIVKAGHPLAKVYDIPIDVFIENNSIQWHLFEYNLKYLKNGWAQILYTIPFGSKYQAGEYNIFIQVREALSLFKGNTSQNIDIIERTRLAINYKILNQRANGKHYVWEPEKIIYTLYDEDNTPLPGMVSLQNGSDLSLDWFIRYQIINGRLFSDGVQVNETGKYEQIFTPIQFGIASYMVYYEGCRFFAPSSQNSEVQILKRPLILRLIKFYHNNELRSDTPWLAHRDDKLTIVASVMDYLNLSFTLNEHNVDFGYEGKFDFGQVTSSNKTDLSGNIRIDVSLDQIGLIQAGKYHLNVRILESNHYQFVQDQSDTQIQIFEKGRILVGPIIVRTENYKYFANPSIVLLDEDNQRVDGVEFQLEVKDKDENNYDEKVFPSSKGYHKMNSGPVKIIFYDGGLFQLNVFMSDKLIVDQVIYIQFENTTVKIRVIDNTLLNIHIPILTDIIPFVFMRAIEKHAEIITIIILGILFFLYGPVTDIRFTGFFILKFLLLNIFLRIFFLETDFFKGFSKKASVKFFSLLSKKFANKQWLRSSMHNQLKQVPNKQKSDGWFKKRLKEVFGFKAYPIYLLEFIACFLYGLHKAYFGGDNVLSRITGEAIDLLWDVKKLILQVGKDIPTNLLPSVLLIFIGINFVIRLAYAQFPSGKGGWLFKWFYNALRTLFIVGLSAIILMLVATFAPGLLGVWSLLTIYIEKMFAKIIGGIVKSFTSKWLDDLFKINIQI